MSSRRRCDPVRRRRRAGLVWIVAVIAAMAGIAVAGDVGADAGSRRHGIAMHGEPALPPGFASLPYADAAARKGGRLTLGRLGSFDSLNPFIVRGAAANGLRDYVYESLLGRSADEPFTLYGLIAGSIDVPDDRSAITFHLRPEARFSDGRPVHPEDVIFSHAVLRQHGFPFHRSHYRKVAKAEIVGERSVRFTFDQAGDREIPLIMGLMPILPSHRLTSETFDRTTLEPPVGSGPYVVERVDPGRSLVYRRNPDYWGRDLAINRGRFNFDEVRFEYFRESSALMEAFRSGEVDIRFEDDPTTWAEGYDFPAVTDGRIVKREIELGTPAGLAALVPNSRRPLFADARVREALGLLFDFEWINRNLYHGLYTRTQSLFERSSLSASGRPADERERSLLAPFERSIGSDALAGHWMPPPGDGSGVNRDNLRRAFALLSAAGYKLSGERLVDGSGRPVDIEFLAQSRAQERLVLAYARTLERLGIRVTIRQVDSAQYWQRLKSFDFDLVQWTWSASLSPGNEQLNRWSAKSADTDGSLNYAGVKSPAVDAMIEAMLTATSQADFLSATRALDRAVMSGRHVVPLFHSRRQWVAHWKRLRAPERTPLTGVEIDTWWSEDAR